MSKYTNVVEKLIVVITIFAIGCVCGVAVIGANINSESLICQAE